MPNSIRRIRRAANVSTMELATLLGVAYQSMWRMETGATRLTVERAKILASYFKVTLEELTGDGE